MKNYLKNEIKLLPAIIVLFIIFYVFVNLISGKSFIKKNIKINDMFTVGDINSSYNCVNGNYLTYNSRIAAINNKIGTGTLTTSSKKLIGAINNIRDRFDNNYVLPVELGGTGGNSATAARTSLEVPAPSDFPSSSTANVTAKGVTIYYQKYGNVITLTVNGTLSSTINEDDTVITTLSSAYRPPANVHFPCFSNQNGSSYVDVVDLFVKSTGELKAHYTVNSGSNLYCSTTYMVD